MQQAIVSRSDDAVGALLRPRSIVIVGASDRSRWSAAVTANLERGGFAGRLHLVNRRGGLAHGRQTLPDCRAVGAPVDVGIVMVPAHAVAEAVEDLGAAGAGAAVLLTSGFAETGHEGAQRQARVAGRARALGLRLMGPNSLGFINFADRVHAWTTPVRAPSRHEGVAIVSQSGATAYFLAELAWQQDLGVSIVAATGNEADLDAADFLDHLVDDPRTRSIAMFIETVRHPARFLAAARRAFAAAKPLVVLKVGASEATSKAAAAHTGALVGDDAVFEGLCRQAGIIRVRSIEELLATADLAGRAGVLREGGLAIVSNSGGICEIAADTADRHGIALPALLPEVAAGLREAMPGFGTPHNPLDLTGGVEPPQCADAVRLMAGQEDVAALLCVWYPIPNNAAEESERLARLHLDLSAALNDIPVPGVLCSYTHAVVGEHAQRIIAATGAPYSAFGLDRTISALAGLFWWSARQRSRAGARPAGSEAAAACGAAAPASARPESEQAALAWLASQGVPVVPVALAVDAQGAVAAARALGGAAVLKVASPDIGHKSDIGGVALDLRGDQDVAAAYARIMAAVRERAPRARIDGVLVAPMRERGVELIVGMARDPAWGPVLAVGLGGVWVETLRDVSLRVLPVDEAEIRIILAELRGAKLLQGQRGVPAADVDAVARAIAGIARAVWTLGPDLVAMEVNPLLVRGSEVEALDALCVWNAPPGA